MNDYNILNNKQNLKNYVKSIINEDIDKQIDQKINEQINKELNLSDKLTLKDNPFEYIKHVSFYTLIIPVIIYLLVKISNFIMHVVAPNYPENINNKGEQLFFLYIHLLLIIIAISIFREEFNKHIKNAHFSAAVFSLSGPIIVIFASDFSTVLKNFKI